MPPPTSSADLPRFLTRASVRVARRQYRTRALDRGCSIGFLSVYPLEKEFLYPPCTFLQPEALGAAANEADANANAPRLLPPTQTHAQTPTAADEYACVGLLEETVSQVVTETMKASPAERADPVHFATARMIDIANRRTRAAAAAAGGEGGAPKARFTVVEVTPQMS